MADRIFAETLCATRPGVLGFIPQWNDPAHIRQRYRRKVCRTIGHRCREEIGQPDHQRQIKNQITMWLIEEKFVKIRKRRNCFACGRVFDPGVMMHKQTNDGDGDGICHIYTCPACHELITQHADRFIEDGLFSPGCVAEFIADNNCWPGTKPEQLLALLNSRPKPACSNCTNWIDNEKSPTDGWCVVGEVERRTRAEYLCMKHETGKIVFT